MAVTTLPSRKLTIRVRPGDLAVSRETTKFVSGLTKSQAEELLDWLEANGRRHELSYLGDNGFAVYYQ